MVLMQILLCCGFMLRNPPLFLTAIKHVANNYVFWLQMKPPSVEKRFFVQLNTLISK